jgi:argininosuccinate lyase
MQRGQPVTLGHHLLAWVEMLERDLTRFAAARTQAEPSPLGSGALAGSTLALPAPPHQVRNSLDGVSDRDWALDYLYAVAAAFNHLSRIAMELCLWATAEYGFLKLPEEAATGSSMMPQKLNPDVAELVRGKAGTAIGRLTGLLAVVKGLPLAYNSDLQEDKEAVFFARRDLRGALAALAVLVEHVEIRREALEAAASDPLVLATDAAEALVAEGVPFRDAYTQVASSVKDGSFEPGGDARASVAARNAPGPGGTAAAAAAARARLSS